MENNNPLLDFSDLPRFNDIKLQHIEPAMDYIMERNRTQIDQLIRSKHSPTWQSFIMPLEALSDQLDRLWAPVSYLNSVQDSDALRQVYEKCLIKMTNYESELGQNEALFDKLQQLKDSEDFTTLDNAQQKSIHNELLDFKLSGVNLDKTSQDRFKEINNALSELANQFSQNILDATDGWSLHIDEEEDLAGLSENVIELAKVKARQQDKTGWVIGLQAPAYVPFITYADSRILREEIYRAYVTRASEIGPNANQWDNAEIICNILRLRNEQAELLNFEDYATFSLQTKMAQDSEQVIDFLYDLADRSRGAAEREVAELRRFALQDYGEKVIEPWDIAWFSEKLRVKKYDFSQEALRLYFPLPTVIKGMFSIVNRLFAISIKEVPLKHRWHSEVRFFQIMDRNNNICGYFYIDLFAREHKRGGAWMADCICRRQLDNEIQLPVAFITCNFQEPVSDQPSLLSHDEVITLFHEFGHALHHLLTKIVVPSVAGINGVPWDAVELPSQFLENWCWEREALGLISGHFQTGEKIPDPMLEKMHAARNFQSALKMLRQIEFSLFDIELHRMHARIDSPESVRNILRNVRNKVAVLETPAFSRFENSFGHIFAGGYAAGYYSYKWAEVLSADAYSLFEEQGIFDMLTGQSFLENILEKGGSEDPMQLFTAFRGRKPEVSALLRHSGLSLDE